MFVQKKLYLFNVKVIDNYFNYERNKNIIIIFLIISQAKLETKALKAKRPGFTDERYNETSYYIENGKKNTLSANNGVLKLKIEKLVIFPSLFRFAKSLSILFYIHYVHQGPMGKSKYTGRIRQRVQSASRRGIRKYTPYKSNGKKSRVTVCLYKRVCI